MYRGYRIGSRGQRGISRGAAVVNNFQPTRPFRGRRATRRGGFPRRPYMPMNNNYTNTALNQSSTSAVGVNGIAASGCEMERRGGGVVVQKAPATPKPTFVNGVLGAEIPKSPIPLPPQPPYQIDVVFQLLVAPEEDMDKVCTKMREHLGTLTQEEKGAVDISSKQIMGFALQSKKGAARAARVIHFLNVEMPGFFKFVCIKRWLWYLMPRHRGNSVCSQLNTDQIFNFGIFLATLYVHFEQTPFREDIHHYLRKLLDCLAVDCTQDGCNRFNHVISLCGIGTSPLESSSGDQDDNSAALKNESAEECKKKVAPETAPKTDRSTDLPEEPAVPIETIKAEEPKETPPPFFREVRRRGRGRPFRKGKLRQQHHFCFKKDTFCLGRVYQRRGVYWENREEENR
ncbi:hypothetical protein TTRE_0000744101 [Trichuris trichiura]|uniref:Uncharacterized protein n=1 Tax=Trichuris trichiura TaxID=36087 RepID=A0A077ZFH9_TRITR|nr:hypothetical protein TTRE_0000744101 [Trichuris trichiura]